MTVSFEKLSLGCQANPLGTRIADSIEGKPTQADKEFSVKSHSKLAIRAA
jgi:hypothetical protein